MTPVESRRLRYFVAVAEELSFVRASQRLHIAPPALSRAISELEAHLGVKLFDRSSRHVALTEAGSALLPDVRRALQDLDAATRRIQRLAGPERRLTVAYKSDMDGGLLQQIGDALANEHPAASVEALLGGWGEQPEQLRQGLADVALLYEPFDQEGIAFDLLIEELRLVALPTANPLAGREVVSISQLEEEFAPTPGPYVWQVRTPDGVGTLPRIRDISHLLQLVELGEIIAMLPASVAVRFLRDPIRYRPVKELAPARLFVAWPREPESAEVASFVRAAKKVAGTEAEVETPGVVEIEMSASASAAGTARRRRSAEHELRRLAGMALVSLDPRDHQRSSGIASMEHLWSRADANSGDGVQISRAPKRLRQAESVALYRN